MNNPTQKITKASTRTDQGFARYMDFIEKAEAQGLDKNVFRNWREKKIVAEFEHWAIIENDFPYDAIAVRNDMIFTKREVPFDSDLLNDTEIAEFKKIKKEYLNANYEVLWENLPSGATVPQWFHYHLLNLKRE